MMLFHFGQLVRSATLQKHRKRTNGRPDERAGSRETYDAMWQFMHCYCPSILRWRTMWLFGSLRLSDTQPHWTDACSVETKPSKKQSTPIQAYSRRLYTVRTSSTRNCKHSKSTGIRSCRLTRARQDSQFGWRWQVQNSPAYRQHTIFYRAAIANWPNISKTKTKIIKNSRETEICLWFVCAIFKATGSLSTRLLCVFVDGSTVALYCELDSVLLLLFVQRLVEWLEWMWYVHAKIDE